MQIAEALRRLRTDRGLSQVGAVKRAGVPDFRTLSHWETDRKKPSLTLLHGYLHGLGLDFCDLQDALNAVAKPSPTGCRTELERLRRRVEEIEGQLGLEAGRKAQQEAVGGRRDPNGVELQSPG